MITEWLTGAELAVVAALSGATVASVITALWMKGRWQQQAQLLRQQAEADARLAQNQEQHYQAQLAERNQDLDELDVERDRLTSELRQMHARLAAALEKKCATSKR